MVQDFVSNLSPKLALLCIKCKFNSHLIRFHFFQIHLFCLVCVSETSVNVLVF